MRTFEFNDSVDETWSEQCLANFASSYADGDSVYESLIDDSRPGEIVLQCKPIPEGIA